MRQALPFQVRHLIHWTGGDPSPERLAGLVVPVLLVGVDQVEERPQHVGELHR